MLVVSLHPHLLKDSCVALLMCVKTMSYTDYGFGHYNAKLPHVSCVCARRMRELAWRAGHANYQHTLAEHHVTRSEGINGYRKNFCNQGPPRLSNAFAWEAPLEVGHPWRYVGLLAPEV